MSLTPNTLATTSLITQIGGGLTSAVGSYYGAKSQASSGNYQARIAEMNAELSENSAQQELIKGHSQIGALTMQTGQLKSKQRTALAANGVDMGEGSAAEQLASTDIMKDIDVETLRSNAVRSAWGHRVQGINYTAQAGASRANAKGANPWMAGASSLLGSAGSVAQSWYMFGKEGAV